MYYHVYLPVNLDTEFTYSSSQAIAEGCRVLVSFNRRDMIGICGRRVQDAPRGVRIREITEVLDSQPLIPQSLLELARWMASYYRNSIGICLFAMLPARLIPDPDMSIRSKEGISITDSQLADLLADGDWHILQDLRKAHPRLPLLKMVEIAEQNDEIDVDRKLKHRDKPRYANFVSVIQDADKPESLPPRQSEAYTMLMASDGEMSMAALSSVVSYSVIKGLVGKGLVRIIPRRIDPPPVYEDYPFAPKNISLTAEQDTAVQSISQGYGKFEVNLLYGVTGSGKTEVYIHIMRRYLDDNKNIIFLIPEISLTPQMVERFSNEFGSILAINHSRLSDAERLRQWQLIQSGQKRIVVGARSAIFAPLPNLGLIVVDEEHEQSYKQENLPRYHGRDMAIVRAMQSGAQVIIGSATPALESWYNQLNDKYRYHRLTARPFEIAMPEVEVLDLREQETEGLLSHPLLEAIESRLREKQQVILFHNRRGYSSYLQCLKCGHTIKCPDCDISMYYHRDTEELRCHYCGYGIPSPRKCPSCNAFSFSYGSAGTQKLEQNLKLLFPSAHILRLDSDSARRQDAHKQMYKGMKNREIDILLGTQMISKGLDFPGVTLVGIVLADISLNVPDFRSAERTFQHLTQVAGRSGRGEWQGEVLIQTYNPHHYSIINAAKQDYEAFATIELSHRQQMYYPPFCRLGRLLYSSDNLEYIRERMEAFGSELGRLSSLKSLAGVIVLGPVPAPLPKLGSLYRFHLVVKAPNANVMRQAIDMILAALKLPSGIRLQIDIDPVSLM